MRTTRLQLSYMDYIPDFVREFFARRFRETVGLCLSLFAVLSIVALLSWKVADPSFSHVTPGAARNLMGYPGAVVADLMMQLFGLGSLMLLAIMCMKGWHFLSKAVIDKPISRGIGAILAIIFASGFASSLPRTERWPLPTGLGGALGDGLLAMPEALFGGLGGFTRAFMAVLFAVLTVMFFTKFSKRSQEHDAYDPDEEDMPSYNQAQSHEEEPALAVVLFGALIHNFLRFKNSLNGAADAARQQVAKTATIARGASANPAMKSGVAMPMPKEPPNFTRKSSAELREDLAPYMQSVHSDEARQALFRQEPHFDEAFHAPQAPQMSQYAPEPRAPMRNPQSYEGQAEQNFAQQNHVPQHYAPQAYGQHPQYAQPAPSAQHMQYAPRSAQAPAGGSVDPENISYFRQKPKSAPQVQDHSAVVAPDLAPWEEEAFNEEAYHQSQQAAQYASDSWEASQWQGDEPAQVDGRQPISAPLRPATPQSMMPRAMAPQPMAAPKPVSKVTVGTAAGALKQAGNKALAPHGGQSYQLPPFSLLSLPKQGSAFTMTQAMMEQNAAHLESILDDFNVSGEIINVRPGPVVTLYELEPSPGTKSSKVIGLADDIARSMSAVSARVAVIPGRNAIGIELPNPKRETVYMRELLASQDFEKANFRLPLCLGKTIGGEPVISELAKMPHLLIAGTTGSGKSVAINTMILSLLYRLTPEECRLIMIDPKMLELSVYDGIPHLLTPVVTDPKKAVVALKWVVREMEERYRKMSKLGVRNIDGFNQRAKEHLAAGKSTPTMREDGFNPETGEVLYTEEIVSLDPMPYIVVIVDEMADLMMVAGKEIEGAIQRLAQMARAAGIHLVAATQRPSVDVITGTIKANFPTRISFQVTSKIDSRTILGEMGAEQLLGQGDMLHMAGGGRINRVHGPFVSDEEVEKVVSFWKAQGTPEYLNDITAEDEDIGDEDDGPVFDKNAQVDEGDLFSAAVKVVVRDKKCSTSYIQRRLGVGYNKAASLVERMEQEGIVGAANNAGKREILIGMD